MSFQSEHDVFVTTLIAAATLSAGDPVSAAGTKATSPKDFYGITKSDAVSGEAMPVLRLGEAAVLVDSESSGVAVDDVLVFGTDGYDTVAAGGFGYLKALSAGAAEGTIRVGIGFFQADAATALTAVVGGTLDTTWGADELAELENVIERQAEIEAALVAAGILTAAA